MSHTFIHSHGAACLSEFSLYLKNKKKHDRPTKGGFNYILIEPLLVFSLNYVF
jgi:hypothetical protein